MAGEHHRGFPEVSVLATSGTHDVMAAKNQPDFRKEFWDGVFPRQLPTGDVTVSVVDTGFELEVGHTMPTPRPCCTALPGAVKTLKPGRFGAAYWRAVTMPRCTVLGGGFRPCR
jgi:hypothetical protein